MLNAKQAAFVREYLIDLNATQAAIRAGYSAKTAHSAGPRLLEHVGVRAAIAAAQDKRAARVELNADYVLRGLTEVAQRCMQKVRVMEFDRESKSMVQAVDEDGHGVWEFDSAGANRSLELLGKHLKLFTEKHEHTFDDVPDDQLEARYRSLQEKIAADSVTH